MKKSREILTDHELNIHQDGYKGLSINRSRRSTFSEGERHRPVLWPDLSSCACHRYSEGTRVVLCKGCWKEQDWLNSKRVRLRNGQGGNHQDDEGNSV